MGLAGELAEGGQSPLGRGVIRIIWVAGERQQCDAAGHLFHFVVGEVSVGVVQGVNALSGQVGEGVVLDGNLGVTAAVDGVVTANAPAMITANARVKSSAFLVLFFLNFDTVAPPGIGFIVSYLEQSILPAPVLLRRWPA